MRQMTLFDAAEPLNAPRFKAGDDIYQVVLDVIEHYKVSGVFSTKVDMFGECGVPGETLWRYHLDRADSTIHNVFGEHEMGSRWFSSYGKAMAQVSRNRAAIEAAKSVIRAGAIRPTEHVAFTAARPGNKELLSQAARIGSCGVFEQQPYCYPFIKVFSSAKEADRFYGSLAMELEAKGGTPAQFTPCDMYKVSDSLWSSYEYAERHGDWSFLHEPENQLTKQEPTAVIGTAVTTTKSRHREHER